MDRSKNIVLGTIIVLCMGAVAWSIYKFLGLFYKALTESDPKIAAAIIGAVATVTAGTAIVLYTQRQIKKREIDEAHREKKVEMYSEFLEIVQRLLSGQRDDHNAPSLENDELLNFLLKFKTEVILWSSPGVLKAFVEFQKQSIAGGGIHLIMPAVEKLYREMRKDIGLSNQGLSENLLVKMYLTNPEELDEAIAAARRL